MVDKSEILIRKALVSDAENLINFFIKSYGEKTIFQDKDFLFYYYKCKLNSPMSNNVVAVTKEGEIVSHYGGLDYHLKLNNKVYSLIWGVNAYTLPEYRGMGLNSKIVDFILNNNEINAVIGFTEQTALFYDKINYNVFEFKKFTRHIFILDFDKTTEICRYINQDEKKLIKTAKKNNIDFSQVVELTIDNIDSFNFVMDEDFFEINTTYRDKDFLKWRFIGNPFIKYTIWGYVEGDNIKAYAALREEVLEPLNYKVNRVIDLYGKKSAIENVLAKIKDDSILKNNIYIDFSMFGNIYDEILDSFGFIRLENDECCILPQVSSPIENRANLEYLGIQSKVLSNEIKKLSRNNVYFTRMDSDRDRLARITQLKNKKVENK